MSSNSYPLYSLFNRTNSVSHLLQVYNIAVAIPTGYPLRNFVEVLEGVNLKACLKRSNKGRHDYEDLTLLKLLFAQMNQVLSQRKIEQACRTDIRFMWLAQGITPSHMSFQRLISQRLKGRLEEIFLKVNELD